MGIGSKRKHVCRGFFSKYGGSSIITMKCEFPFKTCDYSRKYVRSLFGTPYVLPDFVLGAFLHNYPFARVEKFKRLLVNSSFPHEILFYFYTFSAVEFSFDYTIRFTEFFQTKIPEKGR